jgi:ketosteroid isomerase-like protein
MLFAPYHAIVRAVVRHAMADLSAGKTETAAQHFRRDATLCFSGDHALGGELHGRDEISAWFARVRRLFPDLKLTPLDIVVSGGPWVTKVMASSWKTTSTFACAIAPGSEMDLSVADQATIRGCRPESPAEFRVAPAVRQ